MDMDENTASRVKSMQWTWTSPHHTGSVKPKYKYISNSLVLAPLTPSLKLGNTSPTPKGTLLTPAMPPFVSCAVIATFDKCKQLLVLQEDCACVQNGQSHIHSLCCCITCTKYKNYEAI